jgi:hypothetical protein
VKSPNHLQWQVSAVIDVPIDKVWAAFDNLSLIPEYHPSVRKVELPRGIEKRAPGVEYKCVIPTGPRRGWCVEKVIEYEPLRRTTVAFTDDSWGLSKLIEDFVTEISVEPGKKSQTRVTLKGFTQGRACGARS